MLILKIAGALVLVLLLAAAVWRLRRTGDGTQGSKRLVAPPPSPYTPSKGFRILKGDEVPDAPHAPAPPRIEIPEAFVFSDTHVPASDHLEPAHLRHDERWALDRSMKRITNQRSRRRRRLTMVAVVVVAIVVAFGAVHGF